MTTKLRTASFQDDAVTAAKIAANAVGSSELDLTANYAFSGTITGTPNDVVLLNTTTSTDGVNTIELNDIFSTTYRYYKIVCTDLALKEGTGGEYDGETDDGISTLTGLSQTLTLVGTGVTATAVTGIITSGGLRLISVTNRGGGYTGVPRI